MGIVEETIALIYKVDSQDDLRTISNAINGRFRRLGHVVAQKAVESKDIRPGSFVSFTARGRKVYGDLSPENLTCDGELSGAQVARRKRELDDALERCFIKLGRRMTEEEAYKAGAA
jgi:hypothetical protein